MDQDDRPAVLLPGAKPRAARRRAALVTATTVGIGLLVYALVPMRGPDRWLGLALGLATVAVIVPLTVHRARSIQVSDQPILEAVETLVLLLTLLVLGFAASYVVLAGHHDELAEVHTKIDALYFTVSTLGTVGFGDAHATGQLARVIVTAQMLFDLVFVATAIRLLTSVAQRRAAEQRGRSSRPPGRPGPEGGRRGSQPSEGTGAGGTGPT